MRALQALDPQPLRSAHIALMAPATGEGRVEAQVLRRGRTLVHARAAIDGVAVAHGVLGGPREHPVAWDLHEMPDVPPPEQVPVVDMEAAGGPVFTRHFEYRYVGPVPMSGVQRPRTAVWLAPRPALRADAAMLVALLDAGPPPVLIPLRAPRTMSTVELRVRLHHLPDDEGPLLLTARCDRVGDGWADEVASLWDRRGRLLAECQQLIAIF